MQISLTFLQIESGLKIKKAAVSPVEIGKTAAFTFLFKSLCYSFWVFFFNDVRTTPAQMW